MKSGAKNHIHKYYKNSKGVWSCCLIDCTHYLPANISDRINHTRSICHKCGEQFLTNHQLMSIEYPICQVCLCPEYTNLDDYIKDREKRIIEEQNRTTIAIKYDGNKRILVDDKGNETIEIMEKPVSFDYNGLDIKTK